MSSTCLPKSDAENQLLKRFDAKEKLPAHPFERTKNTDEGPVITEVAGPVEVGDELVNVLSRYKFQDGLMYYESTKDTATHFFIDYLPKGTYVFEYSVRVQHRGKYETGIAELQCMYAPEFNSHSGSVGIVVE